MAPRLQTARTRRGRTALAVFGVALVGAATVVASEFARLPAGHAGAVPGAARMLPRAGSAPLGPHGPLPHHPGIATTPVPPRTVMPAQYTEPLPPPARPLVAFQEPGAEPAPRGMRLTQLPGDPALGGAPQEFRPLPDARPAPAAALASPFRGDQIRLPLLPLGSTPQPSAEVQAKYEKYIDRTIDPENVLDLIEGRPRLMVFKQIPFRVQIADPAIADYQQITEREFSVVGQKIGTTVLNFWFADPLDRTKQEILSYLLRVMPDPEAKERMDRVYEALEREINRKFPNSVISLSLVGDKLLIEGQAKDVEEAAHILDIVGRNAPGGPETIPLENINLDVVAVPGPDGELPAYGLENFLLRSQHSTVINRLRIPGVHQVMLKVTVAEVNRSAVRAIGASMAIGELGNAVSFFNFTPEGGAAGLLTDVATGGRLLIDKGDFKLSIDALRTLGLARALAEPNLVTLNGRPANLLVGGSFPIPQTQAFTNSSIQSVDFVPFGVSLSFTPGVVDKDRVRLSVFATISTRDEETGTSINGSNVPGLQARSFSTMVELREGQTLAVAGLVQNSYGANSERVPFLGDLPIVGRIFRRDGTSFDEQELMVLITPMLVEPLNCAQHQELPLPGHDIYEPDDIEFFLLGNLEGHYRQDYRSPARTDWWRMREFRNLQKQFIIGPSGHSDGH